MNYRLCLDCSVAAGQDRNVTFSGETGGAGRTLAHDLRAALAWWRDAGVDLDFVDEAADWLAKPPADPAQTEAEAPRPAWEPPRPAAPAQHRIAEKDSLPADLAAFTAWWLAEADFGDGAATGRIAPSGMPGAALMVLVEEPEAGDADSLLSGPEGKLLGAILAAIGLARDQVYLASALPRHTPAADWQALAAMGLGEVLDHHVRLVAPGRLLVFGGNASSLLGHGPANSGKTLSKIDHEERGLSALAVPALGSLAGRPRGKAALWRALLEWLGPDWTGTEQT